MSAARQRGREILRVTAVIAVALAIGFVITLLVSKEPVQAYWALLTGPLPKISFENGFHIQNLNRFGNWLEESITLVLLGLSVALVFKARQFSLGAEGQLILGALAAGIVALYVPAPPGLHLLLALLAAATAGFFWGLVPGILKAYLNVDEVVSTLMLNVIAAQIYNLALIQWLRDPTAGFLGTVAFPESATLPLLIPGTRVTIALFLALLAVAAVWFLMNRTPFGYTLKLLGSNRKFAEYGGINTKRVIALSMALSGILAGLAGAHLANGLLKRLTVGLSPGIGFEGIVVALLANNDPIGVLFTGLLYGYLRTGAQIMERSSDVTREVVFIIQAIIILMVSAERLLPAFLTWRRRDERVSTHMAEPQG
jgi:general nucleoside transport system permease protein